MINLPNGIKHIAIKMSGGTDSSLAAFLISKYIKNYNLKISITPVIIIEEDSPFQYEFANKCISIIEHLNDFKFNQPLVYHHYRNTDKIKKIREIENTLTEFDLIVSGSTQAPKLPEFTEIGGPDENRVGTFPTLWENKIYAPFVNIDKKEIADLYKRHNLIDVLFPYTRSCVAATTDFSKHCGKCWWCKERIYGFGKL